MTMICGQAADAFQNERSRLFAIAYRLLGSVADADDVLQEAYLRFANCDGRIENPPALLTTIVTRLSIDLLRKLKQRREQYIGPWLPEPLVGQAAATEREPELAESLALGMLLLLEQLDPVERAVFVLREAFDLDYRVVADVVERRADHCRQLFHRATNRLAEGRARFRASPADHERLTNSFVAAVGSGDLTGLMQLLADDVVECSDSGGKVPAARAIIKGAERVARFFIGLAKKSGELRTERIMLNGRAGLATFEDDRLTNLIQLDVAHDRITAIYVQRNPDKLARAARLLGA